MMTSEVIRCKDCKYFYRPVCTRLKCLPIVRSNGYCYLAVKGKYEGDTPTIPQKKITRKEKEQNG